MFCRRSCIQVASAWKVFIIRVSKGNLAFEELQNFLSTKKLFVWAAGGDAKFFAKASLIDLQTKVKVYVKNEIKKSPSLNEGFQHFFDKKIDKGNTFANWGDLFDLFEEDVSFTCFVAKLRLCFS